jgi:hypothetical protein
MNFQERVEKTESELRLVFENSLKIMIKKNRERGDCWRDVGLIGSFLEVRTMYFRLRALVWDNPVKIGDEDYLDWKKEVKNALEDLRNYTMLAELSLDEDNIKGKGDDSEDPERFLRIIQKRISY